jgi:hypothetical protein
MNLNYGVIDVLSTLEIQTKNSQIKRLAPVGSTL